MDDYTKEEALEDMAMVLESVDSELLARILIGCRVWDIDLELEAQVSKVLTARQKKTMGLNGTTELPFQGGHHREDS